MLLCPSQSLSTFCRWRRPKPRIYQWGQFKIQVCLSVGSPKSAERDGPSSPSTRLGKLCTWHADSGDLTDPSNETDYVVGVDLRFCSLAACIQATIYRRHQRACQVLVGLVLLYCCSVQSLTGNDSKGHKKKQVLHKRVGPLCRGGEPTLQFWRNVVFFGVPVTYGHTSAAVGRALGNPMPAPAFLVPSCLLSS